MRVPAGVFETEGLLLQRTAFGEADWIVTMFTRNLGKVSAFAPSARKSRHRYAGGIEAFHDLSVQLRSTDGGEHLQLVGGRIVHPRTALVADWVTMRTAARALAWIRRSFPPRLVEPQAWTMVQQWLNSLELAPVQVGTIAEARLAEFGLQLLAVLGWSLELNQCVRCNKLCPPHASAHIDPTRGGVVCRACGGAGTILSANARSRLMAASQIGACLLSADEGSVALSVVERALESHVGIDG